MPGAWPEAPEEGWLETATTIQMWSQIAGKVRLARSPGENHWWHTALYVSARGVTTLAVPDGSRSFQIDFDFIDHELVIATSDGRRERMPLRAGPVADFYAEFMARMRSLGLDVDIWPVPVEMAAAVPFPECRTLSAYDPAVARRLFEIVSIADMTLKQFRGRFLGKSSPAHLFWGAFDLALTRFSGRRAPVHPGGIPHLADTVTREAYSHEVWSCGFWPGSAGGFERPAFYAYAYPEPPGFAEAPAGTGAGFYSSAMREFLLPWDAVRAEPDPAASVLAFLQATYTAAATHGGWDRAALERPRTA